MKIKVLVDNNTFINKYYLGEPGLSFLIEDGNDKILFDLGYSDAFMKNAKKMGINLEDVTKIVISHGHSDHIGGLGHYFKEYKNKPTIITHPLAFKKEFEDYEKFDYMLSEKEIKDNSNLIFTKDVYKLSDNCYYLGEIASYNDFEKKVAVGNYVDNKGNVLPDFNEDDSAIVYSTKSGLVIITGCSHSGICNIVEHAKKIFETDKILTIIGGFHLFEDNERLEKTIKYFVENDIKKLYPCHCTSFKVKSKIDRTIDVEEVGVDFELTCN